MRYTRLLANFVNTCKFLCLSTGTEKHNVKEVVRVCEPTYKVEELKSEGINVMDLVFDDGTFPPNEVCIKKCYEFNWWYVVSLIEAVDPLIVWWTLVEAVIVIN